MLRSLQVLFVVFIIGTIAFSLVVPPVPPPGPVGAYLNGIFPKSTPGAGGSWELEDALPGVSIASPLRIMPFPGSSDVMILGKLGEIWKVSIEDQTQKLILDIRDRTFKKGEGGSVGMVLHPQFGNPSAPDKQHIFVFYRTKPEPDRWSEKGFNRLSKFAWDAQSETFDPASEMILFQQYDRSTWHNGGAMFFGMDGFLYLSLGDEGMDDFQVASTQRLDGGFFSGILRIDVDNDPARSHPIRRQPQANENPPSGWGETYSQGYSIPNDNPWLSPDSSGLEEFFVIGLRSPYSMFLDRENQQIWLSDVGSDKREEINYKIEKGDNLQWPYMEGTFESEVHEKPDDLIGQERPVYFEYERSFGTCIIGGTVYRGTVFPELNEKYLFGDYTQNKLMALTNTGTNSEPEMEVLVSNIHGQGVEVPESPGISGIHPQENGEILITVISMEFTNPGKIYRLKRKTLVPDPPGKLSELGVFTDLANLIPVPGVIPYGVNAPLWSDRAVKDRWIAIPNNGEFDTQDEIIDFHQLNEWEFPKGTVFIKHFELPTTTDPDGETAPLETRFFVIGEDGVGYGLTYKWNEQGTDAFLLGGGSSKDFNITENGQLAYVQTWDYPSRDQCMTCHNANTKYVLAVNTRQLNSDLYYPDLGRSMNQLDYLNEIGAFGENIGNPSDYLRTYPLEDGSVDLELRIRSYFDANCANCHRIGNIPMVSMDLRFATPPNLQNTINFIAESHASNPDHLLIKPGDHSVSELWIRDASTTQNRMPPIGRNLVDQVYVDSLAKWIDNLSEDVQLVYEVIVFPNPASSWLAVRMNDTWTTPFYLNIKTISGISVYDEFTDSKLAYLDIDHLSAGIYLLEVSAGKQREVRKFIVR